MGCAECGAPDGRCTDDCLMLQDQDRAVGRATADLRAEMERLTRERDAAQLARGLTEEAADSLEEERVSLCADLDAARQALRAALDALPAPPAGEQSSIPLAPLLALLDETAAAYPTDVFADDGTTPDAIGARMARHLCAELRR